MKRFSWRAVRRPLKKLKELVPEGSEVFVNTSETLDTIGYSEYMHGNDHYVNLHDQMMAQPDPAAQREFRRKTTTADYFVGSVQAVARNGGNRHCERFWQPDRGILLRCPAADSCRRHSEDLSHNGRSRGPHPGLHAGAPRPLARGQGSCPHPHRQVHDHGTRAGCRPYLNAPDTRKPRLVALLQRTIA